MVQDLRFLMNQKNAEGLLEQGSQNEVVFQDGTTRLVLIDYEPAVNLYWVYTEDGDVFRFAAHERLDDAVKHAVGIPVNTPFTGAEFRTPDAEEWIVNPEAGNKLLQECSLHELRVSFDAFQFNLIL
jgi:hypothetical protein